MLYRWIRTRRLAAGACVLAVAAVVGPAASSQAAIGCGTRTTSNPFVPWGDANNYFLVQGGTFEDGAPQWSLAGARVGAGNEPWAVAGGASAASLRLPAGSSARSPQMCVASGEDSLRFFYKRPGRLGSVLLVRVEVTNGSSRAVRDMYLGGGRSGWALSPRILFPDVRDSAGQQIISIAFSPRGVPAPWSVDDVYVDPWKSL